MKFRNIVSIFVVFIAYCLLTGCSISSNVSRDPQEINYQATIESQETQITHLENFAESSHLEVTPTISIYSIEKIQPTETPYNLTPSFYLPNETCTKKECLFVSDYRPYDFFPVGIVEIQGYYIQIEDSGYAQTKTCDSFLITNAPDLIVDSILSLIEEGNSLHQIDDSGSPIIHLDLNTLSSDDIGLIIKSSIDNQSKLLILFTPAEGRDAKLCESVFEIIEVTTE